MHCGKDRQAEQGGKQTERAHVRAERADPDSGQHVVQGRMLRVVPDEALDGVQNALAVPTVDVPNDLNIDGLPGVQHSGPIVDGKPGDEQLCAHFVVPDQFIPKVLKAKANPRHQRQTKRGYAHERQSLDRPWQPHSTIQARERPGSQEQADKRT